MFLLYILLVIFSSIDMIATEWVVSNFGIDMELNPVMRYIFRHYGLTVGYYIRILVPVIFGSILMYGYYYKDKKQSLRMMKLSCFLSFLIVLWHTINITRYLVS